MLNLRDLLESIGNNQTVDICCGFDENCTIKTPKTIFYGWALNAYAKRNDVLGKYWLKNVKEVNAYHDKIDENTEHEVIMIVLDN